MGTKAEKISLRPMRLQDLEQVAALERESFTDAWNASMLEQELANSLATYLVLEQGEVLAGYAGYWLVAGEAQITRVAVKFSSRGLGLGRRLTEALVAKAWESGAESVTLEVREHNAVAQRTYLGVGFRSVGIRPNYYEDTHEGAVIMWLYR